jgi:hypothetical protein
MPPTGEAKDERSSWPAARLRSTERGHARGVSEYRTPEEDTIGGHGEDEPAEEGGPDPEGGEKPKPQTQDD